ncbi:hypothetical protein [Acidihalobacter ferrooxydans]|uniref:Uncharacterized protein n=1 Tax=Acidihalobacter ferrooxydans TaxID=1765967 RepID=A0A1P8UG17_9GAMM|nr:hypothetical protein [Acidihalobacter ferrooxydans]APZ42797.1 hypothetical protein BW247_06580 [Acidihalobacter ferrooxydans]
MTSQKTLSVTLSRSARTALAARGEQVLRVQLELLFSCMIRKRVEILDTPHPDALPMRLAADCDGASMGLEVFFRAVGTRSCAVADQPVPDLETFPLERVTPFLPRWLNLDYRGGRWLGEFGYTREPLQ